MKKKFNEKIQSVLKLFKKENTNNEVMKEKAYKEEEKTNIDKIDITKENTVVEENIHNMRLNKSRKRKLGVELLSISVVPIILIGIITCVMTWKTFTKNATDQIEKDLYTAGISVVTFFEQNVGIYKYAVNADGSQGDFWKGDCNISKSSKLLEEIKTKTQLDITIINKERILITTANDEKTGDNKKIELDDSVITNVYDKGYSEFNDSMKIDGEKQLMYAMPMVQTDEPEIMAMIIVSSNKDVSMKETYDVITAVIIIIVVIIVLLSIFVSVFTRGITGSLKAGFKALESVAQGNLIIDSSSLKLDRKDEIGDMNRSIYNFSAEFRKIIANSIDMTKAMENTSNDLNDTAMNTKSSVGIVDRAMENMSDAANKQAAIVVDVNRDMSNLGNMIKNTYAEIKTINDYNMEILNSSRTANKIVSELTYIKESLNSVIDVINKQAGDTYDLTKTIRKYAEMIVSFADETNLLALNATIEAARVGEEGKGFAIVATQIQGLADQSTSVSNDITKAVNLLVDDSKKSLDTMNQVNSVIEKLNINIDSTKEIFNSVNEGIGYSADGLNKIQEQTAGIDKARSSMMKVMGDLQDVSEKNIKYATDTEEVTKHIGKLFDEIGNIKEMTENLVDSVKIFEV